MALLNGVAGRPAVAAKLLALDALAAIVDTLRRASPAEWVSTTGFARRPHGMDFWFLKDLVDPAQAGGTDLTAQLLSCGAIDMCVAGLSAVEQVGAANTNGSVVTTGLMITLSNLDGEALGQIEDKVREIPSALRYIKDSTISNIEDLGLTASVIGTIMAAKLYGKDEGNAFGFAREFCQPSSCVARVDLCLTPCIACNVEC